MMESFSHRCYPGNFYEILEQKFCGTSVSVKGRKMDRILFICFLTVTHETNITSFLS